MPPKSFATVPDIIVFTLGNANIATLVKIPNYGRKVSLYFVTNAGKFAFKGDDNTTINAAHAPVDVANAWFVVSVDSDALEGGKGPRNLLVASAVGGTVVHMLVEAL